MATTKEDLQVQQQGLAMVAQEDILRSGPSISSAPLPLADDCYHAATLVISHFSSQLSTVECKVW